MRILDKHEVGMVSGGGPKWEKADHRAEPGEDVTPDLSGNRTGWCRGYGNIKNSIPKHAGTVCEPVAQ